MHSSWRLILVGLLAVAGGWAQPVPSFEVASVKLTAHGRTADGYSHSSVGVPSPGTFSATNGSLEELIRWAYGIKKHQIAGPAWLNDDAESFDITAKAPTGAPPAEMPLMVRALLTERFKLAVHRETRVMPVYELVVSKNGPRLQEAKPGAKSGVSSRGGSDGGSLTSESLSIKGLADYLERQFDRPVYDKTGVQGNFAVKLEFGGENDAAGRPSIFSALQETLGLKLEPSKGPVEILVIDHIEKAPTEN